MGTVIRDMPLDVCRDCAGIIANGTIGNEDETEDTQHHAAMVAELGDEDVKHLVLDGPDDENDNSLGEFFSHHPCSGCGSRLSGDRFPARVLHVVP